MAEVQRGVTRNDGHPDIRARDPCPESFAPAALQEAFDEIHHVAVPLEVDVEPAVQEAYFPDRGDRLAAEEELEEAVEDAYLVDREKRTARISRVVDGEVADIHRSEERRGNLAVGNGAPRNAFQLAQGTGLQRFHAHGEGTVDLHRCDCR